MTNLYVLDEHGNAVPEPDLKKWGTWYEDPTNRRVALDFVGQVKVSTVFLAIDHNFADSGPPVLWETMVFGGSLDDATDRYTSREAAVAGHATMLAKVNQAAEAAVKEK